MSGKGQKNLFWRPECLVLCFFLRGGQRFRACGATYFFLLRQEKVSQATPVRCPAAPGSLRYSGLAGAAELAATRLRQSSPFIHQALRCSAALRGREGKTPLRAAFWRIAVGDLLPRCALGRHSHESGNPWFYPPKWIPAFARMTVRGRKAVRRRKMPHFCGRPQKRGKNRQAEHVHRDAFQGSPCGAPSNGESGG